MPDWFSTAASVSFQVAPRRLYGADGAAPAWRRHSAPVPDARVHRVVLQRRVMSRAPQASVIEPRLAELGEQEAAHLFHDIRGLGLRPDGARLGERGSASASCACSARDVPFSCMADDPVLRRSSATAGCAPFRGHGALGTPRMTDFLRMSIWSSDLPNSFQRAEPRHRSLTKISLFR